MLTGDAHMDQKQLEERVRRERGGGGKEKGEGEGREGEGALQPGSMGICFLNLFYMLSSLRLTAPLHCRIHTRSFERS